MDIINEDKLIECFIHHIRDIDKMIKEETVRKESILKLEGEKELSESMLIKIKERYFHECEHCGRQEQQIMFAKEKEAKEKENGI